MFPQIKKWSVIVLITSLVVLTFLAILAIWDVFDEDVAFKAIATMGVITFSCLVSITVSSKFEEKNTLNHK